MSDLHTATLIADVDLLDTVEFPVRKSATAGLLKATFAKLKAYLLTTTKFVQFSDVDVSTPPTDGQALVYNASATKWKPGTLAAGGGGTGGTGGTLTAPTVVQSKVVFGDQPATDGVSFTANVTPGNVMIAMATHWSNGPVPAAGWLQIISTSGSTWSGMIAVMKVATAADVGALIKPFTGGGGGQALALVEIAGALPAVPATAVYFQEQNTATPVLNGAAAEDSSLSIGFITSASNNVAPTSLTGVTTISETQGTSSNESPRQMTLFKKDAAAKGAVTANATYAAAAVRYGIMVTFAPQPVAVSGGGTSGGTTPTIRGTNIVYAVNSTYNLPFPTGTVAGDVVIAFMESGYAITTAAPTGWTQLGYFSNGWANGAYYAKVMTAADITTGYVTLTATGSYDAIFACASIVGSTMNGIRDTTYFGSTSNTSYATDSVVGLVNAQATDLVIGFVGTRGNMSMTAGPNLTILKTQAGASASGIIVQVAAAALGKLGINETITLPAANNGVVHGFVALR